MKTKHTPGPWELEEWEFDYGPTGDFSIYQSRSKTPRMPIASVQLPFNGKRTEANARLIAAAPELLEAAIELKDVCNRPSAARTRAEAWRKLDKAIAKALQPNAEVSGAGTASAGLPGYTAGDNTE